MTIDYRNFLVPRTPDFAPSLDGVRALVDRLRRDRWVLSPEQVGLLHADVKPWMRTGGHAERFLPDAKRPRQRWEDATPIPVDLETGWLAALVDADAADPRADELSLRFQVTSGEDDWTTLGVPYPFIRGADEYGYHDIQILLARDYVSLDADSTCGCGADLGYEANDRGLAPIELDARIRARCPACARPFAPSSDRPGEAFRFAVVIDCHNGWPREEGTQETEWKAAVMRRAGFDVADASGRPIPEPVKRVDPPEPAFVLRSPAGDTAPIVTPAFLAMVEASIGTACVSVPDFY